MDKNEFVKLQYETLRQEIKETKARLFQVMGFGLVVVPATQFLAKSLDVDLVMCVLPVLVIVVALLFLSENHALMRCGFYIRHYIESEVSEKYKGWEEWLETSKEIDTRSVDKYLNYCFYILFIIYYVGSVLFAAKFIDKRYGLIPEATMLGAYIAIGIWFLIFLGKNFLAGHLTTSIKKEEKSIKNTL